MELRRLDPRCRLIPTCWRGQMFFHPQNTLTQLEGRSTTDLHKSGRSNQHSFTKRKRVASRFLILHNRFKLTQRFKANTDQGRSANASRLIPCTNRRDNANVHARIARIRWVSVTLFTLWKCAPFSCRPTSLCHNAHNRRVKIGKPQMVGKARKGPMKTTVDPASITASETSRAWMSKDWREPVIHEGR